MLLPVALAQFQLSPINNTVGIFFHEEAIIKISNTKWTLLVYKELNSIRNAISDNDKTLDSLLDTFIDVETPRMTAFRTQVQTHTSLLKQISDSVNLKYREIMSNTKNYAFRQRRGLFNGIGTVWKTLTSNLDASDGEYFNDCIEKVSRDERHIESLLKNQISVTTSVIKSFNSTIQKLQIDEATFNEDINEIQKSITTLSDDVAYYDAQINVLNLCELLMESYSFIEHSVDDILNAITFARLNILHTSIITPLDLVESLRQISQSLSKNNIPLPAYSSSIPQYLDIIGLEAYQSDSRIIFVLNIPLVEPETYTLYHLYPIPIQNNRTGFHHVTPITYKYIARDDDSMLYVPFKSLENCKTLSTSQKICTNALPYPIDSDSICEAQLLKQSQIVPHTCQITLLYAQEYNVQEIDYNLWLIAVSDPLPVTIKCKETSTRIIKTSSTLQLQPQCNGFIGSTRIQSKYLVERHQNITYRNHAVSVPVKCCEHLPPKSYIPNIKPIKLSNIDIGDLNIAQHKLDEYSEELDRMMNEPFINKYYSWFTILTITLIVTLAACYLACKCRRRRGLPRITMPKTLAYHQHHNPIEG